MIKDIPGYPGYYANEEGKVFSSRTGNLTELCQRSHKGYLHVFVRNGIGRKTMRKESVHKLILNTFVGTRQEGEVCRHLNGNPHDNRLINLKWGTPKENHEDSVLHGTATCLRVGEESIAAKLTTKQIYEIINMLEDGVMQKDIAKRFNISQRHVSDIKNQKTWKHITA